MTVSGRAKTQTGLYWVGWAMAESETRNGPVQNITVGKLGLSGGTGCAGATERLAHRPSGNVADWDPGGEQKQQSCSASLGLAFMDDRLLARVFVIRKR